MTALHVLVGLFAVAVLFACVAFARSQQREDRIGLVIAGSKLVLAFSVLALALIE